MASANATAKRKITPRKKAGGQRSGKKRRKREAKGPTGLALSQISSDFISRNYMRFVKKYPGEFVYALGNRVIAHGDDLGEVRAEALKKAGDRAGGLLLSMIPETVEDACMIL